MSKAKNKKHRQPPRTMPASAESKGSDAITVAWAVSVTSLICCNLTILAIHYFAAAGEGQGLAILKELLLAAGAMAGVISLVLLGVMYRVRTLPPPPGLAFFGALVALAPLVTFLVQQFS